MWRGFAPPASILARPPDTDADQDKNLYMTANMLRGRGEVLLSQGVQFPRLAKGANERR
jgi:hypothetical protein